MAYPRGGMISAGLWVVKADALIPVRNRL